MREDEMPEETANVSLVSDAVCDERSKRIEEKIDSGLDSMNQSMKRLDEAVRSMMQDHSVKLDSHQSRLDRLDQVLVERDRNREQGNKRNMLYLGMFGAAISFFSNLDKIIGVLK